MIYVWFIYCFCLCKSWQCDSMKKTKTLKLGSHHSFYYLQLLFSNCDTLTCNIINTCNKLPQNSSFISALNVSTIEEAQPYVTVDRICWEACVEKPAHMWQAFSVNSHRCFHLRVLIRPILTTACTHCTWLIVTSLSFHLVTAVRGQDNLNLQICYCRIYAVFYCTHDIIQQHTQWTINLYLFITSYFM